MKKDNVHSGSLVMIMSLFIMIVFFIPIYNNLKVDIESHEKKEKNNITKGNQTKYAGDINSLEQNREYTVKELIQEGLINKNDKNPITGRNYDENDKIRVINKDGTLIFELVNGKTLYEILNEDPSKSEYFYKGNKVNNYISFNEDIYRIIKVTKEEIYLIKEDKDKKIDEDEIKNYIDKYKNDIIKKDYIDKVISVELPSYELINNTIIDDKSFIKLDSVLWLKDDINKLYSFKDKMYVSDNTGYINLVLVINGTSSVVKGNGTVINPYVIY